MRDQISGSVVKALVGGTILSAIFATGSAILPQYGWVFGALLFVIGLLGLAAEYLMFWRGTDEGLYSVLGIMSLVFGTIIAVSSMETVVALLVVAVVIDVIVAIIAAVTK